jgi:hypothetical protein
MSEMHAPDIVQSVAPRPVLMWLAEGDQTQVKADLQQAGEFLGVPPEAVAAAILSGEPVQGWFVDWEVKSGNS